MHHRLEVSNVIMEYGHRQILSDIYLTCSTGEVIGLVGRNGAGKTTLMKIIFGSLHPINQHVRIDGVHYPKPFKVGNLIAYLPQENFLPPNLTVRQIINLYYNRRDREKLYKDVRIYPIEKLKTKHLSYGQLRYFEILLLISLDVKFVLLDEPFSGLEPIYKEHVRELIGLHKNSKGFIITDHDYRNIMQASDRLVLLKDGGCIPIDGPRDLEYYQYVPEGVIE